MRPSSPTGLGRIGHRLVFLLPGNPVSCLCAYDFFAGRAIRALGGRTMAWPYRPMRGQTGAQDQLADRAAGLCPRASGRRSRRAPRSRRRVDALIDHAGRRLRHRPGRQRRFRSWHRGGGLALCVSKSSFSTCSTATRPSGAFVRRSTSRRAGSKQSRSTPRSVAYWLQTSISPVDVPSFDRSNVDGFAVVSENTFGASEESSALGAAWRGSDSHWSRAKDGDSAGHGGVNCHRRDGSAWRRCRGHGRVRRDRRPRVADRQSCHGGKRRVVCRNRYHRGRDRAPTWSALDQPGYRRAGRDRGRRRRGLAKADRRHSLHWR